MHARLLAALGTTFFAITLNPANAIAADPPDFDRRLVGMDVRPSDPPLPNAYDIVARVQILRWDDATFARDLSTDFQLYVNEEPDGGGFTTMSFTVEPPTTCLIEQCNTGALCAVFNVDGVQIDGRCRPMLPHPGDDAPWCGCGVVVEFGVGLQIILAPGDELELVMTATPGSWPEIYVPDDSWTATVLPQYVDAYCFGDQTFAGCPCANVGFLGQGCRNSTGVGARLYAIGTTSAALDNLFLRSEGLTPGQPVLMFAGLNAVNGGAGIPFGDGLRCAGGNLQRIGVKTSTPAGMTSFGPGLFATLGWVAGDVRFLQDWYRDPVGPCGSGFNLSNGLKLEVVL